MNPLNGIPRLVHMCAFLDISSLSCLSRIRSVYDRKGKDGLVLQLVFTNRKRDQTVSDAGLSECLNPFPTDTTLYALFIKGWV